MEKVVLIFGPTGVKKSEVSIKLAQGVGEIISADSMQIYRDMNIGTAKVSKEERKIVPHHLIDIIDPDTSFTVYDFCNEAIKLIKQISDRGKIPFIVGGTGLYFKALVDGLFDGPTRNSNIRDNLELLANEKGNIFLHNKLKDIDPQSASKIHINDKKRIIRALEVFELTQKPISDLWKRKSNKNPFNFLKIGLTGLREELYTRINGRCDKMLNDGFVNEVRKLKDFGYHSNLQSMQAIGYKHIYKYLNNELDYDEMLRQFKRDSRRYAKRQWTLFLRFTDTHWYTADKILDIMSLVNNFIEQEIPVN
ncbi:MAG: tRNA (adenosine(37)-N6)-dimethylallyltransferase MiaA [Spirochaetota bacterium]|nr:tRNA (adenosine(37)-N6)-dimethylallyltransferase MiaA [Spirochaetota bacterium]